MSEQFSRTELLLGKEAMEALKKQGWRYLESEEWEDIQ